ncbi:hypothetical protein [Kineosporia babensis]|uniref:Uncharacterized protein n=1 Tax=Kineosporia babensis TaxID=499548 RepID=A0A9X1SSL2_9ACTN|nr:hypothetical protein [Kineosporia babensis]MCD5310704.1 hypothetical protein [Kineosporia babensis]
MAKEEPEAARPSAKSWDDIEFVLPAEPPSLTPAAASVLLRILLGTDEAEHIRIRRGQGPKNPQATGNGSEEPDSGETVWRQSDLGEEAE